jgi:translation initiation factor IF-3
MTINKGSDRVRINEEIRAAKVRVIDDHGQVGVMHPSEAFKLAQQRGLDLIEIVPNATPPVCKIMDFGKFKYEQTKKDKIQRKHQHVSQLKELRFHPNTDVHDFEFKAKHAINFLEEKFREHFGTNVRLVPKNKTSGEIIIEYYTSEDLERIIDLCKNK